jgi:hypothetical protein
VIEQLNEALLAKANKAKLLRVGKVRADTTVVSANVQRPTDAGPPAGATGAMNRQIGRIKAVGAARRTRWRDRTRAAGRRARAINSRLRLRQARDETQAVVHRITGELADLAVHAVRDAAPVLRNARRALRTATGRRAGRLRRAVDDLAATLRHTATCGGPDPLLARRCHAGLGPPGSQPARCGRPADPRQPGPARRDTERQRSFRRLVKWRTGREGRIAHLKRRSGWDRTLLDGLAGARIW